MGNDRSHPKLCNCGNQANNVESRITSTTVRRRYVCSCGETWSTVELCMDGHKSYKSLNEALIRRYSTVDRDNIADRLIALAQELLR